MSCFRGQMNEYVNIAIDRFDGRNLLCTAYFLSHCHKDHMIGLDSPAFLERLTSRENIYLFCTELTRLLLLAEEVYTGLRNFIYVLEVGKPQSIWIADSKLEKSGGSHVSVTPISAGHCPGSVMFLFEGQEGTCLYTGDFRWEMNQAAKIEAFRDGNRIKPIKSMYVDTTFCTSDAYHIPSRKECVEAMMTLLSDWLSQSPLSIVCVSCPARYGHEHFLLEVARRLETQIHVAQWKVDIYEQIPDLVGIFSSDASRCRVHACKQGGGFPSSLRLPCSHRPGLGKRWRILNVRPSTMWFTSENTKARPEDLVVLPVTQRGLHRVCYSMHSSYSEIRDLVSYLKPDQAFPNVLPPKDANLTVVQARLQGFLHFPHNLRKDTVSDEAEFKPLGTLRRVPQLNIVPISDDKSSDDFVFSSQESSLKNVSISKDQQCLMKDKNDKGDALESVSKMRNSSPEGSVASSWSEQHSSYKGSVNEELSISLSEEQEVDSQNAKGLNGDWNSLGNLDDEEEESYRLYVSGDSELSGDDDGNENEDGSEFSLHKVVQNTVSLPNHSLPDIAYKSREKGRSECEYNGTDDSPDSKHLISCQESVTVDVGESADCNSKNELSSLMSSGGGDVGGGSGGGDDSGGGDAGGTKWDEEDSNSNSDCDIVPNSQDSVTPLHIPLLKGRSVNSPSSHVALIENTDFSTIEDRQQQQQDKTKQSMDSKCSHDITSSHDKESFNSKQMHNDELARSNRTSPVMQYQSGECCHQRESGDKLEGSIHIQQVHRLRDWKGTEFEDDSDRDRKNVRETDIKVMCNPEKHISVTCESEKDIRCCLNNKINVGDRNCDDNEYDIRGCNKKKAINNYCDEKREIMDLCGSGKDVEVVIDITKNIKELNHVEENCVSHSIGMCKGESNIIFQDLNRPLHSSYGSGKNDGGKIEYPKDSNDIEVLSQESLNLTQAQLRDGWTSKSNGIRKSCHFKRKQPHSKQSRKNQKRQCNFSVETNNEPDVIDLTEDSPSVVEEQSCTSHI